MAYYYRMRSLGRECHLPMLYRGCLARQNTVDPKKTSMHYILKSGDAVES